MKHHTKRCRGSFRMVRGITCNGGTKPFRETSGCANCGNWLPLQTLSYPLPVAKAQT